jgi:hypothetical protein
MADVEHPPTFQSWTCALCGATGQGKNAYLDWERHYYRHHMEEHDNR